ncbi:MAG: F0F1 ATP synthase subunit B family protein [Erythrobacter sp.]
MASLYTLIAAGEGAPSAFGLEDYQWVSLAMLALIAVVVWKKVPGAIAGGLDTKIAQIKGQLDEAKELRAEAEKLRDEYASKIASAEKDAEAMMENASREADAILARAEADSEAMVARRQRMAEDKIAAAEREAVDSVRASAANAAAAASRTLIAERHDSEADKKLADEVISSL